MEYILNWKGNVQKTSKKMLGFFLATHYSDGSLYITRSSAKSKQRLLKSSLLSAKATIGADELSPSDEAVSANLSCQTFECFPPSSVLQLNRTDRCVLHFPFIFRLGFILVGFLLFRLALELEPFAEGRT
jgi:hypothetical protein